MISGIYSIVNKINGHKYIGSSKNIKQRWAGHISCLRHNNHHNKHLQNAWNKYGEDNFDFIVLLECEVEFLLDREQEFIDQKPEYNQSGIAGRIEPTDEVRAKLSEIAKHRAFSDETRIKLSNSHKKENLTQETRDKLSKSHIGNKGRLGQPLSEEHNIKCHEVHRGNKYRLGIMHTEDTKDKLKLARVGRTPALGMVHTEESKKKISEAAKEMWKKRKEQYAGS
jgi:group I intron endonuclease